MAYKTVIIQNDVQTQTKDYSYLTTDFNPPHLLNTTEYKMFMNNMEPFAQKIIEYLKDEVEKLVAHYGSTQMSATVSRSNATIAKIEGQIQKWKDYDFSSRVLISNIPATYSIKEAIKEIQEIANKFVYYVNDLIAKNNAELGKISTTASREVMLKIIEKNKEKIARHFDKLELGVVTDEAISREKLNLTWSIKHKRIQEFEQFFDKWRNMKPKKVRGSASGAYEYNLLDFYKKLEKLKNKQEHLFWKIEVDKVKTLNKPHRSTFERRNEIINASKSPYIIELENVSKYYTNGVTTNLVLKNVDLRLKEGDLIVILGPSGSGKTTLLNIISGMDRASTGKTIIADTNLIKLTDTELTEFRRRNIGYIFQQYGLLPNLTVRENIEMGAHLQDDSGKRLNIDELLKSIGMYDYRNKLPSELSGGQQQRVSILRALAKNPRIIFGDEPTGALDEEMTQVVLEQFVRINQQYKTTMILVTHNPSIADIASCVIRVGDGQIQSVTHNPNPKKII